MSSCHDWLIQRLVFRVAKPGRKAKLQNLEALSFWPATRALRQELEGRFSCSTSTPLKSFRGVIYYPPFNLKSIRACRITRIVESV